MEPVKPVQTIVLDANSIIKNEPSVSTLLATSTQILTSPSVIAEIKDQDARARLNSTLAPFLTTKQPGLNSTNFITQFSKRTGDLAVLSSTDIHVLALAYETGQESPASTEGSKEPSAQAINLSDSSSDPQVSGKCQADSVSEELENLVLEDTEIAQGNPLQKSESALSPETNPPDLEVLDSSDDSEGWITPSNVKKKQLDDAQRSTAPLSKNTVIKVAVITTDFAMQNVLLQLNICLLSPSSMRRVKTVRSYILRCHACFDRTRDMSKTFCGRCGRPTLTRVSCSTSQNGKLILHLKKNMQWNKRGNVYSVPKPVPGSASGKTGVGKGGGKGGWGQGLILAEDQKEYVRAMNEQGRKKEKSLLDEDYLPSILTGDRGRAGGRPKIGAGRNVNSKKR